MNSLERATPSLAVVGCGQMGSGIALTALRSGHDVAVFDQDPAAMRRCIARVDEAAKHAPSSEGQIDAGAAVDRGTLLPASSLEELGSRDIIIEAVREDLATKKEIFAQLDRLCPEHTILASNTSALSITEMSRATDRPDRFGGLHFHIPVTLIKTVEVIPGDETSPETVTALCALAEAMGNEVVLAKDTPGFVTNRLLVPFILDAIRLVEQGTASRDAVDTSMHMACRHPMGPLLLADYIGLDTLRSMAITMHQGLGEERFRPPQLLEGLVAQGHLGVKQGRGFYNYRDPQDEGDHRASIVQRFTEVLR